MRDSFGERHALDKFENQHLDAGSVFFETVNLRDVRVVERREYLRFATETRPAIGVVAQHGAKHLQRDITVQSRIASAIDLPHAAGAQRRDDLVGADPGTGGQRQTDVDYTCRAVVRDGLLLSNAAAFSHVAPASRATSIFL
jgi:hypothetical protein